MKWFRDAILAALLLNTTRDLSAQSPSSFGAEVAIGGGNLGGGAYSTEAKFVAGAFLTVPIEASATWRWITNASVSRYFGNTGPTYCKKVDSFGSCLPHPPALTGALVSGGAQWIPWAWIAIGSTVGGGRFWLDAPTSTSVSGLVLRGELVLGPRSRVGIGIRAEQGRLIHLAGGPDNLESVVLFVRGR